MLAPTAYGNSPPALPQTIRCAAAPPLPPADGRGHGHGVALIGLGDRQRAGIGRILAARGHELLKLAADAPLEQLPLAAAGHGDDGVAVAHGGDRPGGLVQRIADLHGELGQLAHRGILFKNDLPVGVGVDLQRVALADAHGAADLLGDDHAAEVVDPAHDSGCLHILKTPLLCFAFRQPYFLQIPVVYAVRAAGLASSFFFLCSSTRCPERL